MNMGSRTNPNHSRPNLADGLVLGNSVEGKERPVTDDGAERVAVHICPELPAGRVWVAGADELGLEALEFLLVA
jgi:hypothetical protein